MDQSLSFRPQSIHKDVEKQGEKSPVGDEQVDQIKPKLLPPQNQGCETQSEKNSKNLSLDQQLLEN